MMHGSWSHHLTRRAMALTATIMIAFGLYYFVTSLSTTARSLQIVSHLAPSGGFVPTEPYVSWVGSNTPPLSNNPYHLAAAAAAGRSDAQMPLLADWHREPQLWHWFSAQVALREHRLPNAFEHLSEARASPGLLTNGHLYYGQSNFSYALINWELAYALGNLPTNPDPGWQSLTDFRSSFLQQDKDKIVIEAYSKLLEFQPDNELWQSILEEAEH